MPRKHESRKAPKMPLARNRGYYYGKDSTFATCERAPTPSLKDQYSGMPKRTRALREQSA